ncbi:MAG: hypothetical protein A3J49_04260 [Gallionellales bacterium RIFCSPHIGHO2_02_FULL_57_16]|nr:MAG: hypothetical protein A3J49_04260 [Gallionellales bacterium RIFCSPHIGHO2_02_FULL_57_16]
MWAFITKIFTSKNRKACSEWAQVATCAIAILAVCLAWSQLGQMNEQQRWQNYSELNSRYATFYRELPKEILVDSHIDFLKSKPETKRAVRQYFDLYSEEYWLYQEGLIPEIMWTQRISNGVIVNLSEYPVLISGFRYWKEKGAFLHPADFRAEVEKQIAEVCRKRPRNQPC